MAEARGTADPHDILPAARRLADVACRPAAPLARLVFRGAARARELCGAALGVALPPALRVAAAGETMVLWQGPDEFLLLLPERARDETERAIAGRLGATPHALVDVSARQVGFTMSGPSVCPLLASAVMLDLDERAFPAGMTTRTLLGKAEITLWRTAADGFHVEVWRSFAPYVLDLLAEASRGL